MAPLHKIENRVPSFLKEIDQEIHSKVVKILHKSIQLCVGQLKFFLDFLVNELLYTSFAITVFLYKRGGVFTIYKIIQKSGRKSQKENSSFYS